MRNISPPAPFRLAYLRICHPLSLLSDVTIAAADSFLQHLFASLQATTALDRWHPQSHSPSRAV